MLSLKKKTNKQTLCNNFLQDQVLPAILQEVNATKNGSYPIKPVKSGTSSLLFLVMEIYL